MNGFTLDWEASFPKDITKTPKANVYRCDNCKEVPHEIIKIPGPFTTRNSHWGAGLPTTMRHCTCCGNEDGPWVSSKIVGGGW